MWRCMRFTVLVGIAGVCAGCVGGGCVLSGALGRVGAERRHVAKHQEEGTWRDWQLRRLKPPYAVLDGDGEVYVSHEAFPNRRRSRRSADRRAADGPADDGPAHCRTARCDRSLVRAHLGRQGHGHGPFQGACQPGESRRSADVLPVQEVALRPTACARRARGGVVPPRRCGRRSWRW